MVSKPRQIADYNAGMTRPEPTQTAAEILRSRFGDADSLFLAGSVVRGEATASSDLDLVVLYPRLPESYRESFVHQGWPVEAFVHDEETIEYYFIERDLDSGVGSLLWMVSEGIAITAQTPLNARVQARALALRDAGPGPWSRADVDYSRYTITTVIDDLEDARNPAEQRAIVAELHPLLATHFFRSNGLWSATGKTIPRRLATADSATHDRFVAAFEAAFRGQISALIELADGIIAPSGGRLFVGYRSESDTDMRRKPSR